jgi:hypothetical protein
MGQYEDLKRMVPNGYSVARYSPGDGGYRYRFFDTPNGEYFESDGIHTAFGMKAAMTFAKGLRQPSPRKTSRAPKSKSCTIDSLAARIKKAPSRTKKIAHAHRWTWITGNESQCKVCGVFAREIRPGQMTLVKTRAR